MHTRCVWYVHVHAMNEIKQTPMLRACGSVPEGRVGILVMCNNRNHNCYLHPPPNKSHHSMCSQCGVSPSHSCRPNHIGSNPQNMICKTMCQKGPVHWGQSSNSSPRILQAGPVYLKMQNSVQFANKRPHWITKRSILGRQHVRSARTIIDVVVKVDWINTRKIRRQ